MPEFSIAIILILVSLLTIIKGCEINGSARSVEIIKNHGKNIIVIGFVVLIPYAIYVWAILCIFVINIIIMMGK